MAFLRIRKIAKIKCHPVVLILWVLLSELITEIPKTKSFFGQKYSFNYHYYMAKQDEPHPVLQKATCVNSSCFPQENSVLFPYNKSFIDQACSDKMAAGYWPRSFACLWTSTPFWFTNTQKLKNLANIQPAYPVSPRENEGPLSFLLKSL